MGISADDAKLIYDNWQNPSWQEFKKNHPDMDPSKAFNYWNSGGGGDKRPDDVPDVDTDALIAQNGWKTGSTTPSNGGAPGAGGKEPTQDEVAGKLVEWYNQQAAAGKAPSRDDWVSQWGDFGGKVFDYGTQYYTNNNKGISPDDLKAAASSIARTTPPGGTIGSAYQPKPTIDKEKFDYQKDYDAKQAAALKAYQDSQLAISQGQLDLAKSQLEQSKKLQEEANAIQLAGLTGTYNGNPTVAMQQIQQNAKQFEKTYDLSVAQFRAQQKQADDTFALSQMQFSAQQAQFEKNYGLQTAQFQAQKDQFDKEFGLKSDIFARSKVEFDKQFGLSEAGVTGTYNGAPTEQARQFNVTAQQRQDEIAYNAARAGNPLKYLQATRGIGAPVQNYEGMPTGNGGVGGNYIPGGAPGTPGPADALATKQMMGVAPNGAYALATGSSPWQRQALQGGAPGVAPGGSAMGGNGLQSQQEILRQNEIAQAQAQGGQAQQGGPYKQYQGGDIQTRQPYLQRVQGGAPGGYQAPAMPGNISAVLAGAPLPAYGIGQQPQSQGGAPGGYTLRAAGAQAQSNEGTLGKSSRYEAMGLAGVNEQDLADSEQRIKSNLGGGLKSAGYTRASSYA